MTIEDRLSELEHDLAQARTELSGARRRQVWAGVSIVALFIAVGLGAMQGLAAPDSHRVVKAHEFQLLSANGTVKSVWTTRPMWWAYDEEEESRERQRLS